MKHYGDICKLNGAELPSVDIISGGSPCQDLSIAGKRAGLAGERSGLFMEQVRVIKEMSGHGKRTNTGTDEHFRPRPRYMVWENVPGAFSSNGGEDFRSVLEETAKIAQVDAVIPGYEKWPSAGCIVGEHWSIAWRTHDAQYWGVPQRRKRVCLVADFDGDTAPWILFDPRVRGEAEYADTFHVVGNPGKERGPEIPAVGEGLPRDTAQGEEKRERVTRTVADCTRGTGGAISFQERAGKPGGGKGILIQHEHCGALSTVNNQCVLCGCDVEVAGTLDANYSGTGGKNQPLVVAGFKGGQGRSGSIGYQEELAQTLGTSMSGVEPTVLCIGNGQLDQVSMSEMVNTLDTMHDQKAVMVAVDCRNGTENAKVNGTLQAKEQGQNLNSNNVCRCGSVVRRLTPMECERLQGYPDGWTDIGEWVDSKGKKRKPADSPRYKALGNSIALPFWQWLAGRIAEKLAEDGTEHPTMGSLFDGIAGFPLVFKRCGVEPVWASEIEEFAIAVSKRHFPE